MPSAPLLRTAQLVTLQEGPEKRKCHNPSPFTLFFLLELNGTRRLGSNVINDTADATKYVSIVSIVKYLQMFNHTHGPRSQSGSSPSGGIPKGS